MVRSALAPPGRSAPPASAKLEGRIGQRSSICLALRTHSPNARREWPPPGAHAEISASSCLYAIRYWTHSRQASELLTPLGYPGETVQDTIDTKGNATALIPMQLFDAHSGLVATQYRLSREEHSLGPVRQKLEGFVSDHRRYIDLQ